MKTALWSIGLTLLASLLGSFGPVMLKKSSKDFSFRTNIFDFIRNYYLIAGFAFYAVGTLLFIPALKGGELSVLYPMVSTVYVWVGLWSVLFLKEKIQVV